MRRWVGRRVGPWAPRTLHNRSSADECLSALNQGMLPRRVETTGRAPRLNYMHWSGTDARRHRMSSGGRTGRPRNPSGDDVHPEGGSSVSVSDRAGARRSATCGDTCRPRSPLTRHGVGRLQPNARSGREWRMVTPPVRELASGVMRGCRWASHGGGAAPDAWTTALPNPGRPLARTLRSAGERLRPCGVVFGVERVSR